MKTYSKSWSAMIILAAATLTMVVLISTSTHAAGPWYVAPGGSDAHDCLSPATACATINGALNRPGFVADDTILVAIGVYTGAGDQVVLLDRNAVLSGGWDAGFTTQSGASTIDGQGARRGITVNSGITAVVERFAVRNCRHDYDGGGIGNDGNLTLNRSTVSHNQAMDGGGIYNHLGNVLLNNSTVSANTASYYGAGIYSLNGTVGLNNAAVSNNESQYGGGIYLAYGTLTLNNTTVSGNAARVGGGIYSGLGVAILSNATVSANTCTENAGGIYAQQGTVTLQNSILGGNTGSSAPECSGTTIGSAGYNLVGNTSGCTFIPTTGDLTDANPGLGSLEGSPAYHPLLPGSPPVDAGDPAGCKDDKGNPLPTDQRGLPRFGRCDIGAYELQPLGYSVLTVNPSAAYPGEPLTYTLVLKNPGAAVLPNVRVTDTLPISLSYIDDSLTATGGSSGYEDGVITWTGSLNAAGIVTITFGAAAHPAQPVRTTIASSAVIGGGGEIITRTALVDIFPFTAYLPVVLRNYCTPFRDDFSNPASGWLVGDNGQLRWEYLNGEYRLLVRPTDSWAGARAPVKCSDCTVMVDVRNQTGEDGTYGLIFGLSDDWQQFYTFEIGPDGYYYLWRYDAGNWTVLRYGPSSSINTGTGTNRLKLERLGAQFTAYANDQLLDIYTDAAYVGLRYVGLVATSYDQPNVDARFDNFVLYGPGCSAAASQSEAEAASPNSVSLPPPASTHAAASGTTGSKPIARPGLLP